MAFEFSADITDPPDLDLGSPADSAMNWIGYAIVAGMAFVALGVASNIVAPTIGNTLAGLGLVSGQEDTALQLGA